MRRFLIILLISAAAGLAGTWRRSTSEEWAPGVPYTKNWDEAIRQATTQGRLLLIYNGWDASMPCSSCTELKKALSTLARGEGKAAAYRKIFRERFVFLTVECHSESEETARRGPEGPFGFFAHNVPVLVIKDSQGRTLVHQVGFYGGGDEGTKLLAGLIDTALERKDTPAKASWEPLSDALFTEALCLEETQRFDHAIELYQRIADLTARRAKTPSIAGRIQLRLDQIRRNASLELKALSRRSPASASNWTAALKQLVATYGRLPGFRAEVERLRHRRVQG